MTGWKEMGRGRKHFSFPSSLREGYYGFGKKKNGYIKKYTEKEE